jgi:hypothetical protein
LSIQRSILHKGIAYRITILYNNVLQRKNTVFIVRCALYVVCDFVPLSDNLMRQTLRQSSLRRLSLRSIQKRSVHETPQKQFPQKQSLLGRMSLYFFLCCVFVPLQGLLGGVCASEVFAAELCLEYDLLLLELASAEGILPMHVHNAAPIFSGLSFLCEQAYSRASAEHRTENPLLQEQFSFLQDSSLVIRSTTSSLQAATLKNPSLLRSTASTLTSSTLSLSTEAVQRSTFNAANIPLLAEPFVDVARFADSLGVRRSTELGGRNGRGILGIPYNNSQGYSFQATSETNSSTNSALNKPTAPPVRTSSNAQTQSRLSQSRLQMNVRESIMGARLRTGGQSYTLDEYLSGRNEYLRSGLQDSIMHHYDFRKPLSMELSSILAQSSNVSIPFPNNPLTTIFGKPELRLNVNLEINLRLGVGVSTNNQGVASATGQSQVFPIFTQSFQSNISAGIGDKFSINLDNNTQRQFEFDNLLRFAYDGEPDEIFRRIEVGNVTLNSGSTFISGSQALFGARVDLQFGPVFLKILGAQKRGQRKVSSVKGGSVKQPIAIRAYDYARNNFFIHTRHKEVWRLYAGSWQTQGGVGTGSAPNIPNTAVAQEMRVKEIEVWESTPDQRDQQAAEGIAIADIRPVIGATTPYPRERYATDTDAPTVIGETERGRFVRLPESRFEFEPNLGRLTIFNLRQDRTYGIAYRLEGVDANSDADDSVFGTFSRNLSFTRTTTPDTTGMMPPSMMNASVGDSLVRLQMVYRPNIQPGFKKLWERQMQNIYSIGAQQVSTKDTKIDLLYLPQSGGVESPNLPVPGTDKLATVLRVDRVNNSGAGPADGIIDLHLPFIFNAQRGEIIFPSLQPFREGIFDYFDNRTPPLSREESSKFTFPDVYDTTVDAAKMNSGRDRFLISGEVSGRASNRIQLQNAFNLAPGSVKVRLNNNLLEEYKDYRVEYYTGVVELTNPEATLPSANLEIEFEQNDVFQIANKTMLGVRLDLDTKPLLRSKNITADIGVTMMNYTQQIVTERIRLGEEPMNNTMIGADGKIAWQADWLTKALDALPFYDTKVPSTITASGEVAWMLPIPNNRPSDVASDNGKAAIYVDDFEAAQRTYSLGRQPQQWRHASPPNADRAAGNFLRNGVEMQPQEIGLFRGASRWFQYFIGRVPTVDVYPNRSVVQGINNNQNQNALEITFDPDERGIYNLNPNFIDRITYSAIGNDSLRRGVSSGIRADSVFAVDSLARRTFSRDTTNRQYIWGGFMRLLSPFNTNFDNDNIEYLEIVMQTDRKEAGTKMFVDIGQISEDVIPNGRLDTEDGIVPGRETPNGLITNDEADEDVGFDGLSNALERSPDPNAITSTATVQTPGFLGIVGTQTRTVTISTVVLNKVGGRANARLLRNPNPLIRNERDPARDDFIFPYFGLQSQDLRDTMFTWYNGYEGNATSDAGKFPDTEILNPNNGQSISRADAFFRYEVNLDEDQTRNPQIFNKTPRNFITYRIPIRQNAIRVGNPLLTNIQYVRVWWRGGAFKGRVVDWQFVGSQWIRQPALVPIPPDPTRGTTTPTLAADSTLQIGFVGIEENSGAPEFYTLPPGVRRQTQLTNPDPNQRVLQNEQSLALVSQDLLPGKEHAAARFFRPFDVFFYKELKLFFHGRSDIPNTLPPPVPVPDNTTKYPELRNGHLAFIRFGIDTLNYYEYNTVLHQGWQEVVMNLARMSSLKGDRAFEQQLRQRGIATAPDPNNTEGQFVIRGAPTLTRITYVAVGIRNNGTARDVVKLWANEFRAIDPDVNPAQGMAAVGNVVAKLADLGTVNATFNLQQPYFHRLEERFGNRNERQAWTVTSQFGLDKFFPESWAGTSLPITYTYNYTLDKPRFLPQNDIVVETVARGESSRLTQNSETERDAYQRFLTERAQTEIIEQQFAMTGVRLNVPIPFFLFTDITNQLVFNFSYNNRQERSPVAAYRYNFNWRFQAQYAKNFAQIPIRPFGWADSIPVLDFFKDWTLFLLPNTMTLNFESNRLQQSEVLQAFTTVRTEDGRPIFQTYNYQRNWLDRFIQEQVLGRPASILTPLVDSIASPVVRNFDASRQLQMSWKLEDNGLLNPTIDWTVNTLSTMLGFETFRDGNVLRQRTDAEVFSQVFPGFTDANRNLQSPINLGADIRHSQNIAVNFRPRLPSFLGGNRFIVPTARYSSAYAWERLFNTASATDDALAALNKAARVESKLTLGLAFRLKDLANTLIPSQEQPPQQAGVPLQFLTPQDQALQNPPPKTDSLLGDIGKYVLRGLKELLNWDQASFNFTRDQNAQNMGLLGTQFGGTGFMSGLASTIQALAPNNQVFAGNGLTDYGPNALYQMGLVTEPHSYLRPNGFLSFAEVQGRRPANAAMQDLIRSNTSFDFRLQRELWSGASLEISSSARTEYSRNQTLVTRENGFGNATNSIELYKFDRTFFSLHPFQRPLDRVNEFYNAYLTEFTRTRPNVSPDQLRTLRVAALNNAFVDALESFSAYNFNDDNARQARKNFYLPAINWAFRWNSLEQFEPLKGVLRGGSLEHKYVSRYASTERVTPGGGRILDMQTVSVAFEPFLGINAQFDDKFVDGMMTGSARYSTKTQYGIAASNPTLINEEVTNDITVQFTYTRRGFTLPKIPGLELFKMVGSEINIQNDIEFGLQASLRSQLRSAIDIGRAEAINSTGRRIDGTTKILIEPSARYTFSKQVTARLFVSADITINEGAAVPGTNTFQIGVDLRLNLTGGRNF